MAPRRLYLQGTVMDEAKNCHEQAIEDLRLEAIEDLSLDGQQLSALDDIAKRLSRMSDSIDRIVVRKPVTLCLRVIAAPRQH